LGPKKAAFEQAGAAVYALSDEDAPALMQMRDKERVDFITFLSDKQGQAARQYAGLYAGRTTLKPATFVIDKHRKIVYAYLDEDYRIRAGAEEVLAAVRAAAK